MNRQVLIWCVTGIAVVSLWAIARQWSAPEPVALSAEASKARQMWADNGKSSDNNTGDRQHELKALEVSLRENPDHAPILVRMAQLTREQGNANAALRHLQEAVKADPRNRDARLELGRALFDAGDVEGAIRETQRLLELDPSNIDGLYNLGAIYGNLGQDERAREYWKRAVSLSPDSESGRRAKDGLKQIGG